MVLRCNNARMAVQMASSNTATAPKRFLERCMASVLRLPPVPLTESQVEYPLRIRVARQGFDDRVNTRRVYLTIDVPRKVGCSMAVVGRRIYVFGRVLTRSLSLSSLPDEAPIPSQEPGSPLTKTCGSICCAPWLSIHHRRTGRVARYARAACAGSSY